MMAFMGTSKLVPSNSKGVAIGAENGRFLAVIETFSTTSSGHAPHADSQVRAQWLERG
jgi:hypothetical protein